MILKLSLDDIGRIFSCPYYPGVELKTCIFVPYQYRILSSPYFIFARIRFKNNVNDFQVQSTTYSAQIPFDVADYRDHLTTDSTFLNLFQVGFIGGGLSGSTKIPGFAPMYFMGSFVNWTDPNISLSMQVHKGYPSNFHTTPCYSFGSMIFYSSNLVIDPISRILFGSYGSGMSVGGYNSGQNISVVDLSNLPARIRNIYPKSWLV